MTCRRSVFLMLALPALGSAQSVRGTTVDPAGTPISGAVVSLLDERDSVTSRALTSESGEFRVAAAGAGQYRLRTMRIGFRPTTSAVFTLGAGQEIVQQLVISSIPFSLEAVRIADRSPCRMPTDSGAVILGIWEQARTALTATQLTAGVRAIGATIVTYERALEPNRERVIRHGSRITSGLARGLWISPSVDALRRHGYVVTNIDGTVTYYAPDLNVLLSDAFIEDHCFKLETSRDNRSIGLQFEPSPDRRKVPGIRGTLWLDRASSELRRMEFRYANTTREQEYGNAGGHIQFAKARNGAWVISGWNIRMPVLQQQYSRTGGVRSGAAEVVTRVAEIRVQGAELALVTRDRDTLWMRTPLALAGSVADSVSGSALANARVALRGTTLQATTDAQGRFRIPDVLPGDYTVEIRTQSLDAIGAAHSVPFAFTDTTMKLDAKVPTATQLAASLCPGNANGIIAGSLAMRGDSAPPRNASVVASWNEATTTGRRFGGKEARSDARGAFRLCDVPVGTSITLRALLDSASAEPVEVRIAAGERFASAELTLDRDRVAGGTLIGMVMSDVNGQPIPDVEIAIAELSKNVLSNAAGAFRLDDIAPGRRVVAVRRVGYALRLDTIAFAPNRTVERSLLLSRVSTLDTVAVTEPMLRDFEERRKLGLGQFLTRADIEKLHGRPIGSTLSQLRGAGISPDLRSNKAWILTSRPRTGQSDYWCPDSTDRWEAGEGVKCACYAQVYLDRSLMNPAITQRNQVGRLVTVTRPTPPFDVNSIPSAMIEAIEWYAGPAETPPEFSTLGHGCGVLVIHTRRTK